MRGAEFNKNKLPKKLNKKRMVGRYKSMIKP